MLLSLISFGLVNAKSGNMNGDYAVTSVADVGTNWNSDYASKGYEYFDVWGPEIATHYAEVFWTDQGQQPLPEEIVKRFDGKVIAIQGYEQDQVMVQPAGKPGLNPEKDVSVPINWAYNHHYCAWMGTKHSERKEVKTSTIGDVYASGAHGKETMWVEVEKEDQSDRNFEHVASSSWFISEGNGGESRKSFHGYPQGFAQLLESPTSWHITPMQIDTRNREHGVLPESVLNCTNFTECAGYEPRQSRYGRGWGGLTGPPKDPGAYSGILECPCNSRYGGDPQFYPSAQSKIVTSAFKAIPSGACAAGQEFAQATTCFDAVAALGFASTSPIENQTVSDPSLPADCVVMTHADGTATALFNKGGSASGCAASNTKQAQSQSAATKVKLSISLAQTGDSAMTRSNKGEFCQNNKQHVLKEFPAKTKSVADATAALGACEKFCQATPACTACSVDAAGPTGLQWAAIPDCGAIETWPGSIAGDISSKSRAGEATITLSGPADAWFAVGLNAKLMADAPYTIIVNDTGVQERKIGTCGTEAEHCPGTALASSVTVVSKTVSGGVRTVVLKRPFKGATNDHYSFAPDAVATLNYISAVGSSQTFAYHKIHDALTLSFTPPVGPTCVCDVGSTGKLCNTGGQGCRSFRKNCVPHSPTLGAKGEQSGDLVSQDNPTCNSRQYAGGLTCCSHKRIMLDEDQVVPDDLLRYHMKFRFWYQEYKPEVKGVSNASHVDLPRIYWQTEANAGEYDIPPAFWVEGKHPKIVGYPDVGPYPELSPGTTCTGNCPDGDDCECIHTITYNRTVSNMRLIYAGGHCHAPACIGIWLYRNDPGHEMELLCHQAPIYGNGTGTNSVAGMYDEAGYLSLPPCLWGDEPGLHPSVLLPANTELVSIKKNHNTHRGHFGEMASWQMRGINF